ncbi:hypothetical protein LQ318_11320 [Aliifodinibius salicampi]|uniref:Metal-dependent hydrolase, beta-lactamase superfamily II n=1 Tax=Fodinibius salicampi TaxID=1920655 RepID=A0ABT3Q0B2_9BACT|nr:hypothetical protein [Fodinibius salicampi]MCW9713493.1 hypothetical protein [Fodinibius salicampi]
MRIIFKNVGQGDSIILEWQDQKEEKKIGIVDCKKDSSFNPVLDHIKTSNTSSISFMILSHPHYDHFSGFRELLDYCESNKITIERFLLTCYQDVVYLKSALKSPRSLNELGKLLAKVKEFRWNKNIIKHLTYLDSDTKILHLNDEITLETLSPSTDELEFFANKKFSASEENQDSQPFGNWLSTILKLKGDDWLVLLTSDAEQSAIKRVGHEHENDKLASNLILCQAPHHGSLKNHSSEFWRKLKKREPKVAFSVGKNSYNHPNKKVIKKFQDYSYEVFATNRVGGLKNESLDNDNIPDRLLMNIGIYDSQEQRNKVNSQDLVFNITNGLAKPN